MGDKEVFLKLIETSFSMMSDQEVYIKMIESFGLQAVVVPADRVFVEEHTIPDSNLVIFGDWHYRDDNDEDSYPPKDDPLYDGPPGYNVIFTFDAEGKFIRAGVGY